MKKGRKLMKDKRIIGNVCIGYLRTALTCLCLLLPAILIVLPVLLILTGSVMDSLEMKAYLLPAFGGVEGFIQWKLMTDYPTF